MQSTEQKIERAALAGLAAASMDERERSTDISLAELAALVETAGGQPVVTLLQNKPTPDPRTFLGEGKVAELKERILANDCDLAVFDNELSPSQMRVLEEELGVRVLDRSGLILDIFAQRAQTREGQLQVELAQYQYLLPRLIGMWSHLERQGGQSFRQDADTGIYGCSLHGCELVHRLAARRRAEQITKICTDVIVLRFIS